MTRFAMHLLAASVLCALVACGGAPVVEDPSTDSVGEAVLPTMWADSDERLVTVLATLGRGHARSDAYGYDELDALLAYWDPDLVLVDVPASSLAAAVAGEGEDDPFLAMHPEVTEAILPNAARLDYAVRSIGAATVAGLEDRRRWDADNPAGPPNRLLIALTARLRALWLANDAENDPIWVHGDEYLEASRMYSSWLSYEVEEDLGADGELRRMARTTHQMGAILDETDAARVMIFVNPGARWFVEGAVDARDDVRRVPGGQLFRR